MRISTHPLSSSTSPLCNSSSLLPMFSALRPILNKGGAGHYATRAESAERVMPVAERHIDLFEAYRGVLGDGTAGGTDGDPGGLAGGLAAGPARERVQALMPFLRTEIAKMSETLLSYGATPPSGMGRSPEALGETDAERLFTLADRERDFGAALRAEVDAVHHQERTRAILGHNAAASDQRLGVLRDLTAGLRRA